MRGPKSLKKKRKAERETIATVHKSVSCGCRCTERWRGHKNWSSGAAGKKLISLVEERITNTFILLLGSFPSKTKHRKPLTEAAEFVKQKNTNPGNRGTRRGWPVLWEQNISFITFSLFSVPFFRGLHGLKTVFYIFRNTKNVLWGDTTIGFLPNFEDPFYKK